MQITEPELLAASKSKIPQRAARALLLAVLILQAQEDFKPLEGAADPLEAVNVANIFKYTTHVTGAVPTSRS